jgi:hypothetical protein
MSAKAAYTAGTAWPSESTNRSAVGQDGSDGSHRIVWYIRTETICPILIAEVGCPVPDSAHISSDMVSRVIARAWIAFSKDIYGSFHLR